ncbi:MAG: YbaK/EbsC family protein [Acidimicrobiia bacterium]|nr:MAG: YbaK/EbsC family protein [Acidimicrobiia bacterium]
MQRCHFVTADIRSAVTRALEDAEAEFSLMDCDPEFADTTQFCDHYGIPPNQSANAIVLVSKRPSGVHAMFLVLATTRLNVNRMGKELMEAKKVSFASSEVTSHVTGMVVGGVTPFGRPQDLPLFVDAAVMTPEWVIVGGGSRDMKIKVNPEVFERLAGTRIIESLAMESPGSLQ